MASGTRADGGSLKPVAKAHTGARTCSVCGDRLSTYNPGPNCYRHTVELPWRGPTVKGR